GFPEAIRQIGQRRIRKAGGAENLLDGGPAVYAAADVVELDADLRRPAVGDEAEAALVLEDEEGVALQRQQARGREEVERRLGLLRGRADHNATEERQPFENLARRHVRAYFGIAQQRLAARALVQLRPEPPPLPGDVLIEPQHGEEAERGERRAAVFLHRKRRGRFAVGACRSAGRTKRKV